MSYCSEAYLRKMAKSEEWRDRQRIAENLYTPVDTLIQLSEDALVIVRCAVVSNPNTPVEVLEKLTKDEDRFVRANARYAIVRRTKK